MDTEYLHKNITRDDKQEMFKNWWESIPNGQVKTKRDLLLYSLNITKATFHNWLENRSEIPYLALGKIEEVAEKTIFTYE